ncbi:lipid II flippase MurJ [Vibrio cholerae]
MSKVKIIKQPIMLAFLSSVNIFSVFALQIITFNIVGVGSTTDALFLSLALPTLVLSITVICLNNILVPTLAGKNDDEVKVITNTLFVVLCGGSTIFILGLGLTAKLWVPLIASGFTDDMLDLCIKLTYLQLMVIPFSVLYSIQWSLLNSRKEHLMAELFPAIISIVLFPIIIFLINKYGVWGLAVAMPVRIVLQCIVLFRYTNCIGFRYFDRGCAKDFIFKLAPLMLGSVYYKSEAVIDRSLLSTANSGTLSLFYLCQQVYSSMAQIIVKSIVTPSITKLGCYHNNNEYDLFLSEYKSIIKKIIFLSILIFIMYLVFGDFIIGIILGLKGENEKLQPLLSTLALALYLSFVGNMLGTISSGVFYSMGNTKVPSFISMITYTIYVPLKILTYFKFGVIGLSILISLYSMFNFLFISYVFYRKVIINSRFYVS